MLQGKTVLVTGGTGSFGKSFISRILREHNPAKVIIYSRDELKQYEMAKDFPEKDFPNIRFFLGDVRDFRRLSLALKGVQVVIHAAALKHVPAAEYNPFEFIKTNVIGSQNIIEAAIERDVERVVALSTDKACNPINLYGATKLCADKLVTAGNSYSGEDGPKFSVVRYGNVVGSRGSVIPYFLEQKKTGRLPITDDRMTRFWITIDQGVDLVLQALKTMRGGEIFVPKLPSMKIMDLAQILAPECKMEITGIRPGEKLHESMINEDDAPFTYEFDKHYEIHSAILPSTAKQIERLKSAKRVKEGFKYTSDQNDKWLSRQELLDMISSYEVANGELRKKQ